jgi:4-amino-4-deoxy-L-arabinose transferase-like glycosyltransferase
VKETVPSLSRHARRGRTYSPILVLLLAFALRMLLFRAMIGHSERFFQIDSAQYHVGAIDLLQSRQLPPNLDRPPAYLIFLAAIYAAAGSPYTAAIIVQVFISTLTVAIAYRLARLWIGSRVAGVAVAALMSIEVGSILYANQVMTETLFSFVFLVGMAIWSVMIQRRQWRYGLLSGAVLGLATLVRPVLFYFGPLVGLLSLLFYRRGKRERWLAALSVVIAFTLVITLWVVRNYAVTGRVQFGSNQDITLLLYNVRQLRAYQQGISAEAAQAQLAEEVQRETSDAVRQDQAALAAYYRQKALSEIRANWGDYTVVHLKGSLVFFAMPTAGTVARALGWVRTGTGLQANLMTRGLLDTIRSFRDFRDQISEGGSGDLLFFSAVGYELLYLLLLNTGAVWGGIRCLRSRRWALLLFAVTIIGYFALLTGPLSYDARYRIPVIPFMALLAAVAFLQIRTKAHRNLT